MFKPRHKKVVQKEFWVPVDQLPSASPNRFYQLLDHTLAGMDFASQVHQLCAPAYACVARGGRPGIDPVVYFKMLMIGFFEGLRSEREIASRCADSLSLRSFLGYALDEATPEHSSLTVIRQRLGSECYAAVFTLILAALRQHGLLKGRHLGIDASVIEAHASLRSLCERNTEEAYWEYVRRMAQEAGLENLDGAALRNFDRRRQGKKMSNAQWVNPHDPEARIGRTKAGATDMIYQPEHTVDLETGVIVSAEVLPGDHRDSEDLSARVEVAMDQVVATQRFHPGLKASCRPQTLTADKGYFSLEEVGCLQALGLKTIISDPRRRQRRQDKLDPAQRRILSKAQRSVISAYGKGLLRKRGQHIERSFAHVLDAGGLRRTTLRGLENVNKRHQIATACYNLSQLLRHLHGVGTSKQWKALTKGFPGLFYPWAACLRSVGRLQLLTSFQKFLTVFSSPFYSIILSRWKQASSTAC